MKDRYTRRDLVHYDDIIGSISRASAIDAPTPCRCRCRAAAATAFILTPRVLTTNPRDPCVHPYHHPSNVNHAQDRAKCRASTKQRAREPVAIHAHGLTQGTVWWLQFREAMRSVAVGRAESNAVPLRLQGHCCVDDQILRAAYAEVGMHETHPEWSSGRVLR